jgi:N-acetylmuramoyl-L-alanine amidase
VIFLDPGHGGIDSGSVGTTPDGTRVEEKNVALAIALRTAEHLRRDGFQVVLSRTDDTLPGTVASDYREDGTQLTAEGVLADLQGRIDRANASGASVFLSIHLNAYADPAVAGTQTFYDPPRQFGDENQRLATRVQTDVVAALQASGLPIPDRGVTDDQELQTESLGAVDLTYDHLVLLGPEISGRLRPSAMPGALCEVLFLSNPTEAAAAVDPATQDVIANAFTTAIEKFLRDQGS